MPADSRGLERHRALVTSMAPPRGPAPADVRATCAFGTTRDLVSETASLEGIPVRFMDTAGIRKGQDVVEKLGIERSYQAMADADLTLVVVDLSAPLEPEDRQLIEKAKQQEKPKL